MKKHGTIIAISAVLIVAAFFGGMKYGQAQAPSQAGGQGGYSGQGKFGGGSGGARMRGGNGGFTSGDVLSVDDKSMTLKLRTGGSKIIFLSDKTQVMKSVDGSKSDIKNGASVMVSGTANSDGSVTADMVQIRPTNLTQSLVNAPTK